MAMRLPVAWVVGFLCCGGCGLSPPAVDQQHSQTTTLTLAQAEARALAVFGQSCALSGCHLAPEPAGDMVLTSEQAKQQTIGVASVQVPSMPRITPQDSQKSYLLHKLYGTHRQVGGSGGLMPLGGKLSAAALADIEAWVALLPLTVASDVTSNIEPELCGDQQDNNADGSIDEACSLDPDNDGDGYSQAQGDCDDQNPQIHPGATEVSGNSSDEDCSGVANDQDGDGFDNTLAGGSDANDNDPSIYPGAPEICGDGKDNNQSGVIDEGCDLDTDNDGDGYSENQGDCNDNNPSINTAATEITGNTIDEDCSGAANDKDADGDDAIANGGGDCDDTNPLRASHFSEVTGNTIDEDCSGAANDKDGDGFDATANGGSDCNDHAANVYLGAPELLDDNVNNDCDALGITGWTFNKFYTDIIDPKCNSCHDSTPPSQGPLNMSSRATAYANLVNVAASQPNAMDRIEPSDPDNSYLLHKIKNTHSSVPGGKGDRMPPSGSALTQLQINEIRAWIERGAPNDP